jgi:uncharacterized membrane protein
MIRAAQSSGGTEAPQMSVAIAPRTERESPLRSVLKAITYRITGTVTTALIALAVTGELTVALAIGTVEPFVKLLIYYLHERAWQLVPRGTIRRALARGVPEDIQ